MSRAWSLVALAIALAAVWWHGNRHGHAVERDACLAAQAAGLKAAISERDAHLRRAVDQAAALAREDYAILSAASAGEARIQSRFRVLNEEVLRHALAVPADCVLDPDGLRLWAAAHADPGPAADPAAADGAAQPDRAVRAAAGSGGWPAGGEPAAEPHPDDAVAAPVPVPAPAPVGVGTGGGRP